MKSDYERKIILMTYQLKAVLCTKHTSLQQTAIKKQNIKI
jgi:hypothetical protein